MTDEKRREGEVTFEKAKFTLRKVREQLESTAPSGASAKAPSRTYIKWMGEQRYDTGRPGGPVARIDGMGQSGQGPVDILLSALASCIAMDVVAIFEKRRTPIESMSADVTGRRTDTTPRRLIHVFIEWKIDGAGIDRDNAERAIELSATKYCSVHDSLAHDIGIEWTLTLNGEAGHTKKDPTRA